MRAGVLLDGVGEAAVEPGEIHADDGVRLPVEGELEQLVE